MVAVRSCIQYVVIAAANLELPLRVRGLEIRTPKALSNVYRKSLSDIIGTTFPGEKRSAYSLRTSAVRLRE